MSTVKNADLWTVTFLGDNDVPAEPDGDVTWTVTRRRRVIHTETQEVGDAVSPGVYELSYTPTIPGYYLVKASAVVGGVAQSPPATGVNAVP
jgi:hypothetical protein